MSSYDKKINNLFYYWLIFSFFLVFAMVIIGGLTRLTNAGLSITEWELFTGILPPVNNKEWDLYFSLYKEIPQYKLINKNMNMNEFKIIFYWEYFHRFLGRVIGLFFLIPLIYFTFKKNINKKYIQISYFVMFLILLQGLVGWYMVKSGLVNNISVSHYRLSLHLSLAFLIISIIFWNILNVKNHTFAFFFSVKKKNYLFYILFLLIFFQVIIGAFVSGLDAGRIYQTWPLMNYSYFPNDVLVEKLFDLFDFKNHSLIQFYHRNIAYFIVIYIFFLGYFIYKNKLQNLINPLHVVLSFLFLQIFLGIITLISDLNMYLASAHQICSLLLMLSVINLYYKYIN